eukprot:849382-Pyramimonas_sp.AAC.1
MSPSPRRPSGSPRAPAAPGTSTAARWRRGCCPRSLPQREDRRSGSLSPLAGPRGHGLPPACLARCQGGRAQGTRDLGRSRSRDGHSSH